MADDEDEFAYFLPKGIEDDADDFSRYDRLENSMDGGAHSSEDATATSYSGSGVSNGAGNGASGATAYSNGAPINWQASAQQPNVLSQFYQSNHNGSSASNYYQPATSPTHGSSSGLTGNAAQQPMDTAGLSSQQMQFFQQLQIYQQQLLMQQSSSLGNAPSHYTKVNNGLTYDNSERDGVPDASTQPSATSSSGARRRPLPHHSHTSVTIMNRPPAEERDLAPSTAAANAPVTVHAPVNVNSNAAATTTALPDAVKQPRTTTVVSTATVESRPSTAQTWAGHTNTANQQPAYAKHVPTSVVASTKTEKWPTKAAAQQQAQATAVKVAEAAKSTATKTTIVPSEAKATATKPATVVPTTTTKVVTSARVVTKPVATIRHIESESPVPLTATEMAGLNAHHRKGSAAAVLAAASSASPSPAASPSPTSEKDSHVTVIPTRRSSNASRDSAAAAKYHPVPVANGNVFDFLGETDPDEFIEVRERKGKKNKQRQQHQAQPQPEIPLKQADDEEEEEEKTTNSTEEEEQEEQPEEAATAEEEEEETDETAEEEENSEADAEETEETEDVASSSASSCSPSRVSSPSLAVSPRTGLAIAPILKPSAAGAGPGAGATSPGHGRRVSFMQGGAPVTTAKKEATPPKSKPSDALDASAADTSAPIQSTVESVSGVRKRKTKGGKGAARAAVPAPVPVKQAPKEESEEESEDDSDAEAIVTKPAPVASTSVLATVMAFFASFLSSHLAPRSRSVTSRVLSGASYCLGVLVGLLWTLVCLIARVHRQAAQVGSSDHQMAFCVTFLYLFPWLVERMVFWAPPWAAPCLWYAFLMQVFCTNGAPWLVSLFRVLLPLLFLTEGVSHHTLLLELNGAERLVIAFVLASFKTQEYYRPVYLLTLALQAIVCLIYGNHVLTQWILLVVSLMVIHERDTSLGSLAVSAKTSKVASSAAAATNSNADPATGSAEATQGAPAGAAAAPTTGGWLSNLLFGGGVSNAFHRRPRPKVNLAQKARRIGR